MAASRVCAWWSRLASSRAPRATTTQAVLAHWKPQIDLSIHFDALDVSEPAGHRSSPENLQAPKAGRGQPPERLQALPAHLLSLLFCNPGCHKDVPATRRRSRTARPHLCSCERSRPEDCARGAGGVGEVASAMEARISAIAEFRYSGKQIGGNADTRLMSVTWGATTCCRRGSSRAGPRRR
jgi:hypothetical protein